MGAALGWGLISASSLVIGSLLAIWLHLSLRVIALIMAFEAVGADQRGRVRPGRGGSREVVRPRRGRLGPLHRVRRVLRRRLADFALRRR
jgi:hypothetical protein